MENTSLIVLSRAAALERQMAVVSNNIANVNTTAFKGESPLFVEYMMKPEKFSDPLNNYSMVLDQGTARNMTPGALVQTGNPLDLALNGDGYFEVDTLDGKRYTRNGSFTQNDQRELTTSSGLPVLDDTGNRISIPVGAREITVSPDGSVFANQVSLGKLGVYTFPNEQRMRPLGNGLLLSEEKPKAVEDTKIQQGFLEQSNVQSVTEMTNMIAVSRQYENVQRIMKNEHDLLRNAYSKLSKISA